MKRATRRFAKRWGRIAVFVATACAFLAGQTQVEVHEAFVQHVVCAEHGGQLEDVPRAAVGHPGAEKSATAKAARTAPASADDHKACELPPGLAAGALSLLSPAVLHPAEVSFLDSAGARGGAGSHRSPAPPGSAEALSAASLVLARIGA